MRHFSPSRLLKNTRQNESSQIQFFYHESVEARMRAHLQITVFVHFARGAGADGPSAEKDPEACARCVG
jgi:hypothetical protein